MAFQGLFGIPQLTHPEGMYLLKENGVNQVESLLAECCDSGRKRRMVEVFDELSNALCRVADLAEFLRIASPDREFGRAAESACIAIATLVEQ